MKNNEDKKLKDLEAAAAKKPNAPGYPLYPASDDIYNHDKEAADVNPENTGEQKPFNATDESSEDDFNEVSGGDLDVPGGELDDEQERIGNEDEENNYYSLGGDNHNDLEEDKG